MCVWLAVAVTTDRGLVVSVPSKKGFPITHSAEKISAWLNYRRYYAHIASRGRLLGRRGALTSRISAFVCASLVQVPSPESNVVASGGVEL